MDTLLEIDFWVYVEGRKEGMKRIILVVYLLQIQNPMSKVVGTSQFIPCFSLFFFPPWGPFVGLPILLCFSGCKFVTLYVSFSFAWKVHHIHTTVFLCLIDFPLCDSSKSIPVAARGIASSLQWHIFMAEQ